MSTMNSALVTGAGGFIGRHLVRRLLSENVTVVALMLPGEAVPDEWGDTVRTVTGDVRNLASPRYAHWQGRRDLPPCRRRQRLGYAR